MEPCANDADGELPNTEKQFIFDFCRKAPYCSFTSVRIAIMHHGPYTHEGSGFVSTSGADES